MSDDTLDESVGDPAIDEQLTMGIDPWERNWMKLTIALLVGFFAAVTVAGFAAGFQLPGAEDRVDPRTVATEGPWADPGVTDLGNGKFEAYVLAQVWSFSPREITLPVGAEIDIYITSSDLQHGLKVTDTNVNIMVVPGQVSKVSYTFDEVGEFPYICHEYCGSGHAAMFGTVNVVSEADYAALAEGGGDAETESTAEEGDE
ncbi:cytochrome c oxidase subunit II [Ilumatobacter sp.]|uniref:cytochrome c oxidase subunit II n=1 Tax=Ilumatobacter sp. TaxID=1967498 RepID=UPI003AF752D5